MKTGEKENRSSKTLDKVFVNHPSLRLQRGKKKIAASVRAQNILVKYSLTTLGSEVMAAFRGRTSQPSPAQPVTRTTIDSTPDVRGSDSRVNGTKYRSLPTLLQALGCGDKKRKLDDSGRFKTKSELGQFLIDASRLYEEMSNYRDEKLLHKYLHYEPPMHPRRTFGPVILLDAEQNKRSRPESSCLSEYPTRNLS
jgi:hypothetical protein